MTRTSRSLFFAALAVGAPGCDHKTEASIEAAAASARAAVASASTAIERAASHPLNLFTPPADPMKDHEAREVHVPHDGDTTASRTLKAKHALRIGSPLPRATERAALPKTHAGDGKPWECLDHDECYFPRMPFYSQTNQNLAHVKMPKASYDADTSKLTGPIVWDDATKGYALVLDPKGQPTKDPFYNTWLPYGPVSDKDDGYIGWWMSSLCGATAEAMAVMASIAAKSPESKAKPGSWVQTSLIEARKPDGQEAWPKPLLRDHTSLAPDNRQMTDKDLQRLVNMAVREGTSPVGGGGDDVMNKIVDDFEPVGGKPRVETRSDGGKMTTNKVLVEFVRDRFAPVINIQEYKAVLKPVNEGGKLVKYTLTFTGTGGHFLAINGFSVPAHKRPSLLIYDPVYANPVRKNIVPVKLKGATKDGVPVEVTAPDSKYKTALPVLHDLGAGAKKPLTDAGEIADGMDITLVAGYTAIKIE